ncbi:MAG: hypothetical protein Q9226_004490 [Calogaya cf. arnoldii]
MAAVSASQKPLYCWADNTWESNVPTEISLPTKKYGESPNSSWSGTMGSHYLSIFTAWTLATVPMVILALAFVLAVQNSRPQAPPGSFYSDREQANISLGSAIYSKIPSTQLTFIASFSSTLATTLLPALMALCSYSVALAVTEDSDAENRQALPSPYQLQLLISSLEGSLLALWSFVLYSFSSKGRRVAVVRNVWKAMSFLSTIALLALLISMTDAWLNFSVSTVQFIARDVLPLNGSAHSKFKPGRGLPSVCIDLPPFAPDQEDGTMGIIPVLTEPEKQHLNACYSFLNKLNNKEDTPGTPSDNMKEYTSLEKPEGWFLVPDAPPADVDFQATTFGSSTSCKVVTSLCDIIQPTMIVNDTGSGEAPKEVPIGDFAYECKRDRAGLELSGNASEVRNPSRFPSAGHGFIVQYYSDATRSTLNNGLDERGPTYWYAVLLQVPIEDVRKPSLLEYHVVTNHTGTLGNRSVTPAVGLKYTSVNGSINIDTWTTINQSTSPASVISIDNQLKESWPLIQRQMQQGVGLASSAEDVASSWAFTHDELIVVSLGGALIGLPPLSIAQRTTTQVTRIPRAPFITLVVLDLVYAIIGTYLMVAALIAVRKGSGVRDAQARLSTLAVVAESFESPALGDDATDVNMLFAERRGRGENTRRVALVKRMGGGRRFKQIVVPQSRGGGTSIDNTCKVCEVTLYCSRTHRNCDHDSHIICCLSVAEARNSLKDKEFKWRSDDDDDYDFFYEDPERSFFIRPISIPIERLASDVDSYLNEPEFFEAGCQYIEFLIRTSTFDALRLAAEKACLMLRCFPSDPMNLRSDLPGVYLRLGRDHEAYSLVKWCQLNQLSDQDIHKLYPVVPYLDITDANVFEQPTDIISAINDDPSLVNMFCVTLLKIKILVDITSLQQIRALHQKLPPELVNLVQGFIPITDAVRNNHQIMSKADYTDLIADVTDQIKMCLEAVEKANIHLWPSLVNPDLRPGGSRHRPSNDIRTVDFVLDRCYEAWVETPGAIDIIKRLEVLWQRGKAYRQWERASEQSETTSNYFQHSKLIFAFLRSQKPFNSPNTMSNSREMKWLPPLQYDTAVWQRGQWNERMMGRMIACMAIVSNYTMLLNEMLGQATNLDDGHVLSVWMEALATTIGWIYRWIKPMYEAFKEARFHTANDFYGRKKDSAVVMARFKRLLMIFYRRALRVFKTIKANNPTPEDLYKYFAVVKVEDVHFFSQVYVSRRSAPEIVLEVSMLTWYFENGKDHWHPGDDISWRTYPESKRQAMLQDVQLYAKAGLTGLPRTLGVVWLPSPFHICTGGTLVDFDFLSKTMVENTDQDIKAWYTKFRQDRYTPPEQQFIDSRIEPVMTEYRTKMADKPADVDEPNHKIRRLEELLAEGAPWRSVVDSYKITRRRGSQLVLFSARR